MTARMLLLICMTSGAWAFAFGLGSQVVTHWLKVEGSSDTVIGLAHSFYYFGVAAGSCAVPALTRRFGPASCAMLGMIGAGATLAAFPLGAEPIAWCGLRFLNGWAGAMSLVPLETLVSRASPADKKTINFACYGLALTVGGALGIALGLHYFDLLGIDAFFLGALPPVVAGGVVAFAGSGGRDIPDAGAVPFGLDIARNSLSYGTALFQGFLEGDMLHFLAPFLMARGFSGDAAGILMGMSMIGVILFQVPIGALADRWGTARTLGTAYIAVALGLLTAPWLSGVAPLGATLLALGAWSGAMYPLGLSLLSEKTPAAAVPRVYARYLAFECIGSLAGAAATGWARDLWGQAAMFGVAFAALALVLATWLILQFSLRKRASAERLGHDQPRMAA